MLSFRKHILVLIVASALIAPLPSAATPFDYDVSISPGSVLFVPGELYVGERVRIYANIANLGSKDVTGTVGFYQGPNLLAPPHPFSLRADSVTEDVWIDWTPTEGRYNIMVKIDTDIPDQSPSNNAFLTPMMLIGKRPPPPVVQLPSQPSSGSQNQNTNLLSPKSELEKTVTKKTAQKISETLTPKLPVNPPAERVAQSAPVAPSSARKQQQLNEQESQTRSAAVKPLPSEAALQPVAIAPQEVKGERAFADRIPSTPLRDATRRVLLIGILIAAVSLAAGGFFLHKSRA